MKILTIAFDNDGIPIPIESSSPDDVLGSFAITFEDDGMAHTLPISAVSGFPSDISESDLFNSPDYFRGKLFTKTHDSGWTITGVISTDYYTWIRNFGATHPKFGFVSGSFEDNIAASSEEAYKHFLHHHEPITWNYDDA